MKKSVITFSIVIPTHRRPRQLSECLAAIAKINYPPQLFEVIVVDDGATLTEAALEPARDLNLIYHRQEQSGPATARNVGVNLSKNDFLVFLDDDCQPDAELLNAYAAEFSADADVLLGGKTINSLSGNLYSSTSQLLIDFLYDYFESNPTPIQFFTSNNLAVSRENFRRINGFDQKFPLPAAEDRDFCRRWRCNKGKMKFAAPAQVFHAHHLTLRSFWRQHFNYGRGAHHFHQFKIAANNEEKHSFFNFYRNLILFPSKQLGVWKGAAFSFLFALSQIATAFGFFYEKLQSLRPNLKSSSSNTAKISSL